MKSVDDLEVKLKNLNRRAICLDTVVGYSVIVATVVGFLAYTVAYINDSSDCTARGGALVDSPLWYECVEKR